LLHTQNHKLVASAVIFGIGMAYASQNVPHGFANIQPEMADAQMMGVFVHGVPDFESWFELYSKAEADGLMTKMGVTKSIISEGEKTEDGTPTIQVLHFFPQSRLADIWNMFSLAGPPFTGEEGAIAKGTVIPPLIKMYSKVKMDWEDAPRMLVCASHGVRNFDEWFEMYQKHSPAMTQKLGITKSTVAEGELLEDGTPTIQVIHRFPAGKLMEIKEAFKMEGPPFVGGEDLIAKGIVILPCTKVYSTVKLGSEPEMMVVVSHGVSDFDGWFEFYNYGMEKHIEHLGVTKAIVCEGEMRADWTPTIQVIQFFPVSKLEAVKQFLTFKGPPFVGGVDLIEKGVVIPPFTVRYSTVRHSTK